MMGRIVGLNPFRLKTLYFFTNNIFLLHISNISFPNCPYLLLTLFILAIPAPHPLNTPFSQHFPSSLSYSLILFYQLTPPFLSIVMSRRASSRLCWGLLVLKRMILGWCSLRWCYLRQSVMCEWCWLGERLFRVIASLINMIKGSKQHKEYTRLSICPSGKYYKTHHHNITHHPTQHPTTHPINHQTIQYHPYAPLTIIST